MNFIQIAEWLISILPQVYSAIQSAEQTFGAGQGPTKLGSVLAVLDAAHAAAPTIQADFQTIKPIATDLINGLVAVKNAVRPAGASHP